MKNCITNRKSLFAVIFIFLFSLAACTTTQQSDLASTKVLAQKKLSSPDKSLQFTFTLTENEQGKTIAFYQISKNGQQIIKDSKFELELDNHMSEWALAIKNTPTGSWMENLELVGVEESSHNQTWQPVYGEKNEYVDNYQSLTLKFIQKNNPNYMMNIDVRLYDQGAAFRYSFPDNPTGIYYRIMAENTEFSLPEHTKAWYMPWAQGPASLKALKDWQTTSERPLTLELANGKYVALAEAKVIDYVRTKFDLSDNKADTIVTKMHDPVDIITGTSTPWRVVMVADSAPELLENNFILLNLNDENKITNTDWIKPGKIVRDMTLTNEGAYAWIDFAAEHNIQYLLFDWKWYGPAFTFESDAGTVSIDLDLPNIIKYGKEKGVGIWVYVNQQALLAQDKEIFPKYKEWGLAGVKYGFVQVGSHRWTAWLHDSIQRAADNQLMVNIHDEFRLTGEERTWPNIVTVEGIRGNEEMPDATNNTVLPFTRGLAGMGDYTICYYNERIKTTHAHQLALSVVMYSPLQTLFWYDGAKDYQGEPEIEYFSNVPTVWDNTDVLSGEVGEYIVTARQSGEKWFVGGITNTQARTVSVDFDFLEPGVEYAAKIYFDDSSVNTRTQVGIKEVTVNHASKLDFDLKASGGVALMLTPIK
mgnify:CR=1 FL=1